MLEFTSRFRAVLIASALTLASSNAQALFPGTWNPLGGGERDGFTLRQTWINTTYVSSGFNQQTSSSALAIPTETAISSGALFGWTHNRPGSNISLSYTPSYTARLPYSELNVFAQSGDVHFTIRLSGRWSWNGSLGVSYGTLEQFLTRGSELQTISVSPATPQEVALAGSAGAGQNVNSLLLLSGQGTGTLSRNSIYAIRAITSNASNSLTYNLSPRTAVNFSMAGSRTQYLSGGDSQQQHAVRSITNGSIDGAISTSVNRQTVVGASLTAARQVSSLEDISTNSMLLFVERSLGHRWFTRLGAGASEITLRRQVLPVPSGIQSRWEASAGFRARRHTVFASLQKSAGDPYGIGGQSTVAVNGSWNWSGGRAASWSAHATAGEERIQALGAANTNWHASAGVTRRMNSNISTQAQYSYTRYLRAPLLAYTAPVSMAAVSLVWTPHSHRHPL